MSKKVTAILKGKLTLLAAVILAAIVGGATTSVVMASIPDAGGTVHGCYRNKTNKGTLRIIDTNNGGTCTAQESPLSWEQTGAPQAFATLYKDGNGTMQINNSRNVDSLVVSTQNAGWWCLKLNASVQNPHVLLVTPGVSGQGFNGGSLAADLTPLGVSVTDFGCNASTSAVLTGGSSSINLPMGTITAW